MSALLADGADEDGKAQSNIAPSSVTLTWSSVTNRAYFVQRATNLVNQPAFSLLQTTIPGLARPASPTPTHRFPAQPFTASASSRSAFQLTGVVAVSL